MKQWLWCVILAFALAPAVRAQETTTGSIGGLVADEQGLPLPGATVTVTAAQGAQTFVTDSQGRFFAPFLTPGTYTVRVELQGFRASEQRNVEVRLGQRAELSLKMGVGGVSETVEVTGTRGAIDPTNTT